MIITLKSRGNRRIPKKDFKKLKEYLERESNSILYKYDWIRGKATLEIGDEINRQELYTRLTTRGYCFSPAVN